MELKIFTDGSVDRKKNGAFSVVITNEDKIIGYKYENSTNTTNNREELKAVIEALKVSTEGDEILTDSAYVVNGITGRRKANRDLWDIFECFYNRQKITWIKGHNNNKFNDVADILAKSGILWEFYKEL